MAATNEELEIAQKAIEKSLSEKVPFVKGSGAPVTAPYFAGQMYYDESAADGESKWYFSHDDGGLVWLELSSGGSGSTSLTTWYELTGFIANANDAAPAFVDGDFFLLNSNTSAADASWGVLPGLIEDGDIIKREGGAWILEVDISTKTAHSVIAEFDGLWAVILGENGWLNIPQYNPALSDSIATVSSLGGIPAGTTVAQLRYQTWGDIIDQLVFPIVLPTYTLPTLVSSNDVFVERGLDLEGILSFTFNIGDAGNASSDVVAFLDNVGTQLWAYSTTVGTGTFVTNVDLNGVNDVVAHPDAGEHVTVRYTVNHAQGAAKNDSHGNVDTRTADLSGNAPVQASNVIQSVEYGSLYPYWVIASSDPALDPGDDNNAAAAPVLTETWIRDNMNKALFNEDGLNKETSVIPVPTGTEYVIAACPPGFNVTAALDTQYGFSYDAMTTQLFTLSIDEADPDVPGTNLATYNIHFFRNVAIGGWAENQNITVTIE